MNRDIPGYPKYNITDKGEVYSTNGKLKKQTLKRGYYTVSLCRNSTPKTYFVHRLVATTFIPNPEKKKQINHKDGDVTNNQVGNLEWCTRKENIQHAFRQGLNKGIKFHYEPFLPPDTEQFYVQFRDTDYAVSTTGFVFNMTSGKYLRGHNHRGEQVYYLRINGKRSRQSAKRLVAEIYVDNPKNKPNVTHKDRNKMNNHYSNLEWVTVGDLSRRNAQKQCVGVCQYDKDGNFIARYKSMKEASEKSGVGRTVIRELARGITKKSNTKFLWSIDK